MNRYLPWIVGGAILGGIIHIVAVLVLPGYATGDAWHRLARFGGFNQLHILPTATPFGQAIADMDPALEYAICRFDISEGPLRIDAVVPPVYWSVAIYDRNAGNYYTLNNRSAGGDTVRLWVADQEQILQILPDTPADAVASVPDILLVKSPERYGLAILRAMVPDESLRQTAIEALQASDCQIDSSILLPAEDEGGIPLPELSPLTQ